MKWFIWELQRTNTCKFKFIDSHMTNTYKMYVHTNLIFIIFYMQIYNIRCKHKQSHTHIK